MPSEITAPVEPNKAEVIPFPGALKDSTDGLSDPELDLSVLRMRLLAESAGLVNEQRLLSLKGLLELSRELGVEFHEDSINQDNLAGFIKALQAVPNLRDHFFLLAFETLVRGQLALDEGELPPFFANEEKDPIAAYTESLRFAERWISASKGAQAVAPAERSEFMEARWRSDWRKAVNAAVQVRDGAITILREGDSETTLGAASSDVAVQVFDRDGKPIIGIRTFVSKNGPLGHDEEVAQAHLRRTPRVSFDFLMKASDPTPPATATTLADSLVSEAHYPARESALARTEVSHVVAVLPLSPQKEEVLFKVSFDGGAEAYLVDVVTADTWHTEHRKLVNPKGGPVLLGVPSSMGSRKEEFFTARSSGILGTEDATIAERTGAMSKAAMLVIRPAISAEKAATRRAIQRLQLGTGSADDVAQAIIDGGTGEEESLMKMQTDGLITKDQNREIGEALQKKRALTSYGFGQSRGFGDFDFGGLGGGGNLKSSGESGFGERLHVRASGVDTGTQYGKASGTYSPDPFATPRIIVVHPFGITGVENPETAANQLAKVIPLSGKRKA
jgi:hypothetical protein